MKALAKKPAGRQRDMRAFVAALRRALAPRGVKPGV